MKKITVITVVYNSEKLIENTIKSVVNQTFKDFEYLIVDGLSKDNTLQIINKYKDRITLVSEKDNGLYDAMNKAIKMASGEYIVFINSGDKFASNNVLKEIFENPESQNADVIYGDTNIIDANDNIIHNRRHRPPKQLNKNSFKKGMLVCHQSFVAKKEICPLYDLNYKYSADFDWCIKILKKSQKNFNFNAPISNFLEGGQTRKTIVPGLKERFRIMVKHFGFFSALFNNIILGVKFFFFVIFHRWF